MRDDGIKYEDYCCKYLQEKGYSTRKTVASGDQGADIIAYRDGIKAAVQCKYRTEGSVGNEAVQQALAGMHFYDCHLAIVMTNVDFTQQAYSAAKKMNVILWPRIKMISKNNCISNEEENDDEDEHDYEKESLSSFLNDSVSNIGIITDHIEYGKALSKSRFPIAYYDRFYFVKACRSHEDIYLKGKELAVQYLDIINKVSDSKFAVVDWFYSSNSDKSIFLFEADRIINDELKKKICEALNKHLPFGVSVEYVSCYVIAVTIINLDKNKQNNEVLLIGFITNYIKRNITQNIISTNTDDELVTCIPVNDYSLKINGEDVTDEYGTYSLFTCTEVISRDFLSTLKEEANTFFRRKVVMARVDDHSFLCGIKKLRGMNDYLTLIDVNNILGRDYTEYMSITAGRCDNSIDFTVRLKKVDITCYAEQLSDSKSRATIFAYLEQINYFVSGIINLNLIEFVKKGKINISLQQEEKKEVEGLDVEGIYIKVVDANNRIVYVNTTGFSIDGENLLFPIKLANFNFVGEPDCPQDEIHYIGLDAMMIQKMIQDAPYVKDVLGDNYTIDILKDLMNKYVSVLCEYANTFIEAYNKMASCQINDNSVLLYDSYNSFEKCQYSYNIPHENAFLYSKYEYEYSTDFYENYYFWKLLGNHSISDLIWQENYGEDYLGEKDEEIRRIIEECLSDNKVKYKYTQGFAHYSRPIFTYELKEGIDLSAVLAEIRDKVKKIELENPDYHLYCFRRGHGHYAFVFDNSYGSNYWYEYIFVPLSKLKKSKNTESDYSYWLLDSSLSGYCDLQSKVEKGSRVAMLSVCLKGVSVINICKALNSIDFEHSLWTTWFDLLLSFVSLNSYLISYYLTRDDQNAHADIDIDATLRDSDIAIYDRDNILLAIISEDEIFYSYFYADSLRKVDRFKMQFTKSNSALEMYKKDIIPIINETIVQRIKTLEDMSKKIQ